MNKKSDFILIMFVLFAAAVLWMFLHFAQQTRAGVLVVVIDGVEYARYDLNQGSDQEIAVSLPGADGGYNLLEITGSSASVTDADCPDRLCVKQHGISRRGECIICLPHKLVIQMEQGKEGEIDTFTY